MFIIKVTLLLFALFVGLDMSIPCLYRIPLALGAVFLEQILNAHSKIKKETSPTMPRYSHALLDKLHYCSHQNNWGFTEDWGVMWFPSETALEKAKAKGELRPLSGEFTFKCEDCGLTWSGNAQNLDMPQFIKPLIQYARTH